MIWNSSVADGSFQWRGRNLLSLRRLRLVADNRPVDRVLLFDFVVIINSLFMEEDAAFGKRDGDVRREIILLRGV